MTNKTIIIDAAHREETRVVVLENGILQDFDRESISVKQIKGNIYLAKVTRVEPSLQAAFVDYGSERHGFLPFADIHPDFFNIPESEKQKIRELFTKDLTSKNDDLKEDSHSNADSNIIDRDSKVKSDIIKNDEGGDDDSAITTGSYSVEDEAESFRGNIYSVYKKFNIQDVIRPGQSLLVQVIKEERGNKGASMSTYISLAGKYCVLMTNTPNKGGVSRKVDNFRDRKLLKALLSEMNVPLDRSIILRTAGVGKRPDEIKRDYEYISRLWDSIKESARTSSGPSFIHAEDDVIKRCIRDVYNENISEVIIEGKLAYDAVSNFIKMTMPFHNHNIKFHDDRTPIFNKYRVEQQIQNLYEKNINLRSGGSIVIDHTEALVAIDVNSGRSTKESNVEETAFQTNLEAAKEVARQLRLRDLAGLIVIDFIDMYDQKHRRQVERTLRDELQNDRSRIQMGRISVFGLLELSRQRLGASLFETITQPCKHCNGTGYVRSVEILAMSILRSIRYSCTDKQVGVIYVYTSSEVISYMMNYKKNEIISTEKNYNVHIFLHHGDDVGSTGFAIKKRKGLSEEERREIEMEVVTGKVNQMGLERSYNDENQLAFAEEVDDSVVREDKKSYDYNNNKRRGRFHKGKRDHRRNDRRNNNSNQFNNNHQKNNKGIIGSLFNMFKK